MNKSHVISSVAHWAEAQGCLLFHGQAMWGSEVCTMRWRKHENDGYYDIEVDAIEEYCWYERIWNLVDDADLDQQENRFKIQTERYLLSIYHYTSFNDNDPSLLYLDNIGTFKDFMDAIERVIP